MKRKGKTDGLQKSQQAVKPYSKLVRDKIPGIIKKSGQKPITKIADDDFGFLQALKEHILDEAKQLRDAKTENQELEEIIDIMEAVNAYMKHKDVSVDKIEKMRKFKLRKRGGFGKRVILEGVE